MIIPQKIAIICHYYTSVPVDDLLRFLIERKTSDILLISHPLFYREKPQSKVIWFVNRQVYRAQSIARVSWLPLPIQYMIDVLLSMYWLMRFNRLWNVCIGVDNLNALTAVLMRLFGKIKAVVYYTIDFTPTRFSNRLMNECYHFLEALAVEFSDITWNVSKEIQAGRNQIRGLSAKKYQRQITVPIGIWLSDVPKHSRRNPYSLVYAGGLSSHQGLQLVIECLPAIIKWFPSVTLTVIGKGSYENDLKSLVKKYRVTASVHFLGYLEDHSAVLKELSKHTIGLALYHPELSLWSKYADPSKIKSYLACGLAVVTTNVTPIARQIEKQNCGVVVPYTKQALTDALFLLLSNQDTLGTLSKSASMYGTAFDWNDIFNLAFEETVDTAHTSSYNSK